MNLVRGTLVAGDGERMMFNGDGGIRFYAGLTVTLLGTNLPAQVVAGFRPEHVLLTTEPAAGATAGAPGAGAGPHPGHVGGGIIEAEVVLVEQLGREYIVHMQAGGQKLSAVARGDNAPQQGARVVATPDPARLYFFDAESGARIGG